MNGVRKCPECGSHALYVSKAVSTGQGINLAPDLGGFLRFPKFDVVMCGNCGLTRLYADAATREKLGESSRWRPL
jgi:predicted nucleic-acid-binding Zn-ribbon protein